MIFNIETGVFGGPARSGDLIAIANVVAHMRKQNPEIKFHMKQGSINSTDYCGKMYNFLLEHTDYFSETPGEQSLPWRKVNIFDFRDISGDQVIIKNDKEQKKKIVVCPVLDAPYNQYRNWPESTLQSIIGKFSEEQYKDYEKVVCVAPNIALRPIDGWQISTDYDTNLNHILEAEIFVGGDTATSHLAGSLDNGPKVMLYFYSSRALVHSFPMHYLNGRGKLITYWLDFEGTTWS